ncbi:MAG: GTP 3',8-cyclase MoaA [Bacteroidota bacterium]|nr:GTP 3',8-cyclase MoaA [Bacteroidota bacterium]MDX5428893.1 GTP 3',8-cyclase MoaA [Bacteroidota bacterium]MDX5447867.1 GTP 3',8-cyclase MoaA [Bacteroidota bacterium]MDX5506574.1 GTP 3',8-cyclase MoaA [Bacteroidota bacterium]
MSTDHPILTDRFGREHTYLRISLTELCNLRCTYCMPAEGIPLSPRDHIMNYDEIYTLAELFVKHGVTKIRLTGGEPLVRKDVGTLIRNLAKLPVELALTTNGVNVDRFVDLFQECQIKKLNVSLDTLRRDRFQEITRRDHFDKVLENIHLLVDRGFNVKVNTVLIKDFNEDEIIDFIELTRNLAVSVRFIEFMPFNGNQWDKSKMVGLEAIMKQVEHRFRKEDILRIPDAKNDTTKNYRIRDHLGSFGIISTVTNPFCDSCNRLRLTANGRLKNCLFSATENDLLTPLRHGEDIEPIIQKAVMAKHRMRGGLSDQESFTDPEIHGRNRSMISIGG